MPDQLIVKHCSPTLAGIKTGSLFSVASSDRNNMNREIRQLNSILLPRGLRVIPVRFTDRFTLIYIYRIKLLKDDLKDPAALSILRARGYKTMMPEELVTELARRLADYDEFPHEIGLFLGYPPSDVKAFIDDPYSGFKYVGYWKVYGNVDEALETFERFDRCTEDYMKAVSHGMTLSELTVAS